MTTHSISNNIPYHHSTGLSLPNLNTVKPDNFLGISNRNLLLINNDRNDSKDKNPLRGENLARLMSVYSKNKVAADFSLFESGFRNSDLTQKLTKYIESVRGYIAKAFVEEMDEKKLQKFLFEHSMDFFGKNIIDAGPWFKSQVANEQTKKQLIDIIAARLALDKNIQNDPYTERVLREALPDVAPGSIDKFIGIRKEIVYSELQIVKLFDMAKAYDLNDALTVLYNIDLSMGLPDGLFAYSLLPNEIVKAKAEKLSQPEVAADLRRFSELSFGILGNLSEYNGFTAPIELANRTATFKEKIKLDSKTVKNAKYLLERIDNVFTRWFNEFQDASFSKRYGTIKSYDDMIQSDKIPAEIKSKITDLFYLYGKSAVAPISKEPTDSPFYVQYPNIESRVYDLFAEIDFNLAMNRKDFCFPASMYIHPKQDRRIPPSTYLTPRYEQPSN